MAEDTPSPPKDEEKETPAAQGDAPVDESDIPAPDDAAKDPENSGDEPASDTPEEPTKKEKSVPTTGNKVGDFIVENLVDFAFGRFLPPGLTKVSKIVDLKGGLNVATKNAVKSAIQKSDDAEGTSKADQFIADATDHMESNNVVERLKVKVEQAKEVRASFSSEGEARSPKLCILKKAFGAVAALTGNVWVGPALNTGLAISGHDPCAKKEPEKLDEMAEDTPPATDTPTEENTTPEASVTGDEPADPDIPPEEQKQAPAPAKVAAMTP